MTKYLLIFLFLCSLVSVAELAAASEAKPTYPVVLLFGPDGYVTMVVHLTPYLPGDFEKQWWEFEAKMYKFTQWTFFDFMAQNWLKGNFTLRTFNLLSRNWMAIYPTHEALGISKDEYLRWLKTGELVKDADYAARLAEEEAQRKAEEEKQVAENFEDITNLKYFINLSDGIYHQTPDCPDCLDDIEIPVLSLFEMGSKREQCQKCFGVK